MNRVPKISYLAGALFTAVFVASCSSAQHTATQGTETSQSDPSQSEASGSTANPQTPAGLEEDATLITVDGETATSSKRVLCERKGPTLQISIGSKVYGESADGYVELEGNDTVQQAAILIGGNNILFADYGATTSNSSDEYASVARNGNTFVITGSEENSGRQQIDPPISKFEIKVTCPDPV